MSCMSYSRSFVELVQNSIFPKEFSAKIDAWSMSNLILFWSEEASDSNFTIEPYFICESVLALVLINSCELLLTASELLFLGLAAATGL